MRASDPVDSLLLMRVGLYFGPACFFILTALWTKLLVEGTISTGVFVVLVVANVPITLAGIALIYRSIGGTATLLANTLTAAGDIPPPPSYPNQDVLIAQGKYAEAAEYFRDHVRVDPADCDARLRLAELYERHLAGPGGAEPQYPAAPGALRTALHRARWESTRRWCCRTSECSCRPDRPAGRSPSAPSR